MAPDFSIAFCLRPHEALAARMKITMFTFRERENNSLVIHNFDWFTMMWTPSLESTTLTIGVWTHLFWWDKKNWLPWYLNSCTYQDDYKDGSCEAPDQRVVDGEPAEVWVAVTLRVKTYCQTYTHTHTEGTQRCVSVQFYTCLQEIVSHLPPRSRCSFWSSQGFHPPASQFPPLSSDSLTHHCRFFNFFAPRLFAVFFFLSLSMLCNAISIYLRLRLDPNSNQLRAAGINTAGACQYTAEHLIYNRRLILHQKVKELQENQRDN